MIMENRKQLRQRLEALMRCAIETNGAFKVIPPNIVKQNTSVLSSDDVVDALTATRWTIEFRNGDFQDVEFTDVVLFLFNFREICRQVQDADDESTAIRLISTDNPKKVMKPAIIRDLFGRMDAVRKESA